MLKFLTCWLIHLFKIFNKVNVLNFDNFFKSSCFKIETFLNFK